MQNVVLVWICLTIGQIFVICENTDGVHNVGDIFTHDDLLNIHSRIKRCDDCKLAHGIPTWMDDLEHQKINAHTVPHPECGMELKCTPLRNATDTITVIMFSVDDQPAEMGLVKFGGTPLVAVFDCTEDGGYLPTNRNGTITEVFCLTSPSQISSLASHTMPSMTLSLTALLVTINKLL